MSLTTALARMWLGLGGWSYQGELADEPKMVVAAAPHTSNWDFVVFLAALSRYGVRARFLGKHSLFEPPLGWAFRRLGGIAVDRRRAGGLVAQVAEAFESEQEMILVIAPEGTRRAARFWRSGFYEIAQATGVPIVLAAVDYPSKVVTIGPTLPPGSTLVDVMDEARRFYRDKVGLVPENAGPVVTAGEIRGS